MLIDLDRGFAPWKQMFIKNEQRLNEHGGRLGFAGTEKNNDNKLKVIMNFDFPEAFKNFADDEELTKIRVASGVILKTATTTVMSLDSLIKN